MLLVEKLSVAVNNHYLVLGLSFDLHPGEVLAVVGPNGAGKSTLLKTLCGDLMPSEGKIVLEDNHLDTWTPLQQAQKRAVLPQESTLSFPFLVLEVVLMGRNPHSSNIKKLSDEHIAKAAAEKTEVLQMAHREYPTLSGGEKQCVQLARVLAQIWEVPETGNRYLFLDEPTNNLDLAHQHHMLELAKSFAKEGTGVLAVLHDLNLAAQYADRILMLCQGQCVSLGTPEMVLTTDTICKTFNVPVMVTRHPCFDCPLVISADKSTQQISKSQYTSTTPEVRV